MNALNLLLTLGTLQQIKETNDICDFDCWIRSLVIHIPLISYTIPVTHDKINLTNAILQNISLTTMHTSFYPDSSQITDGLLLNITFSAQLNSDINYKGFVSTDGNLSATITNVNIQLPLKFTKDNDDLISSISIYDESKCHVTIDDVSVTLHFDNKYIDKLIELLHDPVIYIIKLNAQKIVCQSLDPVIKEYGTELFTTICDYIRPYINGSSSIDIPIDASKMSDLRESQVVDLINFLLTNLTTGDTPFNINSLINRFSKDTGIFDYQDLMNIFEISPDLSFNVPVNLDDVNGTIKFSLNDFVLSGLNTWKDFSILNPISPFVLDTHTALDFLGINLTFQINVTLSGLSDAGNVELSEKAFLQMEMENNSMDFLLQLAAEKGVGLNYTISQCTDPSCLMKLASTDGTGFKKFEFNTSINVIDMESAEATIEEEIQETINTICDFFVHNYKSKIPVFLNGFLNEFGRSYFNDLINNTIRKADCKTYHEEPYNDFGALTTIIGGAFSFVGLVALLLLAYAVHRIRSKSENDNISLSGSSTMTTKKAHKKFLSFFRNDSEASLFMHPKLPMWVRILMPFLVCTCISLFLSSNGSTGASVFLKIHLGNYKKLEFPSIFDFALIKSIEDMWNAKAYILSMCVAIGSCVWPYTKLLLMLVAWILPSTIISKKVRDRILRVLFVLGKWSLIDSYFMILTVVGFHFVIDFPIVNTEMIKNPSIIYIWVYPSYGFITLIISTIYSLALSHLVCYINRNVSNPYTVVETQQQGSKSSVFKQQNLASKILLVIFLPFALVLFLAGTYVNSFSFEFMGLTGWALENLDKVNKKGYSIIQFVPDFVKSCENPNEIKTRIIQIIYLITAVISPALHIIALGVMLFVPMTKKQLFSMYNTCEVLYSWSCLDVFTVSIFISVVQISLLTDFMVGDKCDLINAILKKFFTHDYLIDGHYKCFEIHSILENGIYILMAAAIINTVAALWINAVTRKVLESGQETGDYIQIDTPEVLLNSDSYISEK